MFWPIVGVVVGVFLIIVSLLPTPSTSKGRVIGRSMKDIMEEK